MALTDKGYVQTQGTHLYMVNPTGPALLKLTCPTGITGITDGEVDQIEDTCLDETEAHTFTDGLATYPSLSVPFNLKPSDGSHQLLFDLQSQRPRPSVKWMVLLSESDDPPVLAGSDMTPPATRSTISFEGRITNVSIDAASNDIVRGTLTIQRTSERVATWYEPA